MYTLINGSPKFKDSNSQYFLNKIIVNLDEYNIFDIKKRNYEKVLNSINESEVIVFAFPLYVDSPPSIMLEFLDYIIDKKIDLEGKLIYTIINCGFREGKQNITAVIIIKRWCQKVNATYGSSILIGAGEIVGKEKYKFVSTKALKKINDFSYIIKEKKICDDIITTMNYLNNKLYCYIANLSWNHSGKENGLSSSLIRIK